MDFELIAIALGDVGWIALAFALGLLSRAVGLPPMVGFLTTGFLLNLYAYGIASGKVLRKLADLGITLLLFTIGIKLNLRTLERPQVWAVAGLHMSVVMGFAAAIRLLALAGAPFVSGLGLAQTLLIAFAFEFFQHGLRREGVRRKKGRWLRWWDKSRSAYSSCRIWPPSPFSQPRRNHRASLRAEYTRPRGGRHRRSGGRAVLGPV